MNYFCLHPTPLGTIILASNGTAITGAWFDNQKHVSTKLIPDAIECNRLPILRKAAFWYDEYFKGNNPVRNFPIDFNGTEFQHKVWEKILEVPYGQTSSYGSIAKALAKSATASPISARAVGNAVGRNPIIIIIPCHRIITSAGKPGGYAGGTDRKECLLRIEGSRHLLNNVDGYGKTL